MTQSTTKKKPTTKTPRTPTKKAAAKKPETPTADPTATVKPELETTPAASTKTTRADPKKKSETVPVVELRKNEAEWTDPPASTSADDSAAPPDNEAHTPNFDDGPPLLEGQVLRPGEKTEEEQAAAEAAAERKAYEELTGPLKKVFYMGLCGGTGILGNVAGMRVPGDGPLKSLNLASYGDLGWIASCQLFDRLWKIEFFRKQLEKLESVEKFMREWGGIYALVAAMAAQTMKEVRERKQAAAEAAKDATGTAENGEASEQEEAA